LRPCAVTSSRTPHSREIRYGAFAALCCLEFGIRQSEITRRLVNDVDPHQRVLHVEGAKTEAGNLVFEIPGDLWPLFAMRITNRKASEPLLPASSKDGFHTKEWLTSQVTPARDRPGNLRYRNVLGGRQ
jgi:hypothetical protein